MKKFICAALAAVTCLSVGIMANAADANYYSNTGLAHTNCNAHKYTVSAEEWQRILDKDEADNDTDGIGGWGRPIRMTQHGVQILNFDGSVLEEVEYSSDISITPSYVSNFWKDLWESTNLKSASADSKMTQSTNDIIKNFTVTPDDNSYLYYKDGGLWLHSAGIVPLPGVNNVPFTWSCTYGEGMQAEGMVVIDASAEVDTLITNMTTAEYNAVSNFTMTFSVTNYRYNFVFNMMEYDEVTMWPNARPDMFGSYI